MTPTIASALTPLLRLIDPETAHGVALHALRLGLAGSARVDDPRLGVDAMGLSFANPLGLAAGFDKDAVALAPLARLGFGFVEAGTVTPRPQTGNPRPRLFRLTEDRAVINRLGFNNAGIDTYLANLAWRPRDLPVGGNIGINKDGADPERDYPAMVAALTPFVDYIAINVSSPNTPGLRDLQGEARLRAILQDWRFDRARIRPAVAPTIPLHCRDEFLASCRDLATEFEVGVHTHMAESKIQAVSGQARYGKSLTAHMGEMGLLGPRFTAAHGVWLEPDDMRRLAAHGASVAHNPASNMRLGNGIADLAGMLAAGLNVGIGTDAATCSDNLSMYASMHFAAAGAHVRGPDPAKWPTAGQIFAAATTGSARALGFERIGRIAPGYEADIVFLDLDAPTLIPLNEPLNQMVFAEDGTSVDAVMIGGRFVVRGRRLLTVDLAALSDQAADLRAELERSTRPAKRRFDCVAPIIADFCPALAMTEWPINRWCSC